MSPERKQRIGHLLVCLAAIVVGFGLLAAATPKAKHAEEIVLKSADGKNQIIITCKGGTPGIWITRDGADASGRNQMVAIYNNPQQGAVVSVYGNAKPGQTRIASDVAIAAKDDGGQIQVTGPGGGQPIEMLDADKVGMLLRPPIPPAPQ